VIFVSYLRVMQRDEIFNKETTFYSLTCFKGLRRPSLFLYWPNHSRFRIYDLFKGIACERKRKNEKGKKKRDCCLLSTCVI